MQNSFDNWEPLLKSINELKNILEKQGSIEDFLTDLVSMVAEQMQASACSVYLYDAQHDYLVLRATKGLNTSLVGNFNLKTDKGIVGQCFTSQRSLNMTESSKNPHFLTVPEIGEEKFPVTLVVPILRGTQSVGVLCLQNEVGKTFPHNTMILMRGLASYLATILEDAEFFMELSHGELTDIPLPSIYKGRSIGQGFVIGDGIVFDRNNHNFLSFGMLQSRSTPKQIKETQHSNLTEELTRFANSLKQTKEQLEDIQKTLKSSIAEAAELIFTAHLLMLRDTSISDAMQKEIEAGMNAETAIRKIIEHYARIFLAQHNPRVQEKAQDILDLGNRLLWNLDGANEMVKTDFLGQIIILADTFPSEMLRFAAARVEALIILGGGETAHIALLARSLSLPCIFVKDSSILDIINNTKLLIDLDKGEILLNPNSAIIEAYQSQNRVSEKPIIINTPDRCRTKDGHAVCIQANVNLVQDVRVAAENKAEGIGLYRSEFPFLVRNNFPSEEEQCVIYKQIFDPFNQDEVVIRTLDAGGDKLIGYGAEHKETNPFLGYRGIRFSLSNEEIFLEQIRAILRSGAHSKIGILFPMISSLDELLKSKKLVERGMEELQKEGIPFCENPRIGTMIEVPSAVEIIAELAKHCDFLSIGTNDLIMYLLAVDRTNEQVEHLFSPYHPSVLRVLHRICENVGDKISELSICGEAGADPMLIPFFLGLGIRKLSVDPKKISHIKNFIGQLKLSQLISTTNDILGMSRTIDIQSYLKEQFSRSQQNDELVSASIG